MRRLVVVAAALVVAVARPANEAEADPVIATHPRILFNQTTKPALVAKKNANDPSWVALKARADTLATYTINPYKSSDPGSSPPNTIFFTYQGEGWLSAAIPLAFAYQMTGDTAYSNKLIQLAQEMIRAQSDPENNPPLGTPPLQPNNYYASRNLCSTLGFIFDYCYDQLSPTLKADIVTLMNAYFDDVRVNGYQAQNYSSAADGNFFGGHLYGVALMGYASFGDNARAQEMIDWARIRFDGTPGTVPPASVPLAWRTQCFDGGQKPAVALDYNGPSITGNPFKSGFDFQAWSYGSEEFSRMIDTMLTIKSATGEDVITPHASWFSQILRAEKHALFSNGFMIDPTGDWGGFQGAVISKGLPTRLAYILAGRPDGPGAQHLLATEILPSTIMDVNVAPAEEWAEFFFADASRPSTELVLPPYYGVFAPAYPQGATSPGGTNGAIPYFIVRSDWGASATWASAQMGCEVWDDHEHFGAGHIFIARGGDHLLVSASEWKTTTVMGNPAHGGSGILGDSVQRDESSLANTLYFDDFGDFQTTGITASGGQLYVGIDQVVADELNQDFGYVRSDLSTAYNRMGDPADTPNRLLDHFYRTFLYARSPNVFVVFDQVAAKPSMNVRGPYRKHLRWHVPESPTIALRTAQMTHGASRLYLDVVKPSNATLTVVDELANPDPCEPADMGCVPFGISNAGTYRLEVRDPTNPLAIDFLTVLYPTSTAGSGPTTTALTTSDSKMTGTRVDVAGSTLVALFNAAAGQVPAPVTTTSYAYTGPLAGLHALGGMTPGVAYDVTYGSGTVTVTQGAGALMSSPAGVLFFSLSSLSCAPDVLAPGVVAPGAVAVTQTTCN